MVSEICAGADARVRSRTSKPGSKQLEEYNYQKGKETQYEENMNLSVKKITTSSSYEVCRHHPRRFSKRHALKNLGFMFLDLACLSTLLQFTRRSSSDRISPPSIGIFLPRLSPARYSAVHAPPTPQGTTSRTYAARYSNFLPTLSPAPSVP